MDSDKNILKTITAVLFVFLMIAIVLVVPVSAGVVELWNTSYDSGYSDYSYNVATDSSEAIIVTGYSYDGSTDNYYTIKYDSNGNELWNTSYDGGYNDLASGVATDLSDNLIVTGKSYDGITWNFYTVKYSDTSLDVISCDSSGNEVNQFTPGQDAYVKAIGGEPGADYKIWIQDNPVTETDALVEGENPVTSETPKNVTADSSGNISPTLMWSILLDAYVTHHEYDIVLDKQDDGSNTGIYNSDSDGIDSADVFGFTAPVPEVPSFVLVGVGIIGFVGLLRGKRTKKGD